MAVCYSAKLAIICTTCIEGCQAVPKVLLHALRHYGLWVNIILAHFNLVVSTPTAKLPKFNLSNYLAIQYVPRVSILGPETSYHIAGIILFTELIFVKLYLCSKQAEMVNGAD